MRSANGALGIMYSEYPRLICATYNLQQQRAVGSDLQAVAVVLWVALALQAWRELRRRGGGPLQPAERAPGS